MCGEDKYGKLRGSAYTSLLCMVLAKKRMISVKDLEN